MRTTLDMTGEPLVIHGETSGAWRWMHFDSMEHALSSAMARLSPANDNELVHSQIYKGDSLSERHTMRTWYGVDGGPAEVVRALLEGHRPGADMVEEMLSRLPSDLNPPRAMRRRPRWGEAGDSVDMQRVWGGALDRAWRSTVRTEVRAPRTVRLVVVTSASWKAYAQDVAWRGVAALSLARLLEAAGNRVEIVGAFTTVKSYPSATHQNLHVSVTLKSGDKPLDVVALCGPLTVMGFSRHVGFALRAHGPHKLAANQGKSVAPENTPWWRPGDVGGFEACFNEATTEKFIRAKLVELGLRAE